MVATPEQLMQWARNDAGSADFGPGGWQEGLEQLVAAVATDHGDDSPYIPAIEANIHDRLVTRLRIEQWYAQHGAETAHPVEGPLVIVGLARTATTALQYLLAVDPRFRYPRTWELKNPVPPPDAATEAADPRRVPRRGTDDVQHIAAIDGPAEDGRIHGLHFRNSESVLAVPTYTEWWRGADHRGAFVYHERMLRLLQSHRPPHHWLLKFPSYLFQLEDVAAHYPNAKFVMTHRDPCEAIPSTCSVVMESCRERLPGWSPDADFGRQQLAHFAEGMRRAMAGRRALGEERFVDVGQLEVQGDPVAVAERIYEFSGLALDDDLRAAIVRFAAENQRGSRGAHRYSAEQFGLTPEGIRDAFADYFESFGDICARGA